MKILIADYKEELYSGFNLVNDILKDSYRDRADVEIEMYEYKDDADFKVKLKDVDVLIIAFIPITKDVLDHAPNLKVISVDATGYGNVDVEEATRRKIGVCNVREYCTTEVAEHTMGLMLALSRSLKQYEKQARQGIWSYETTYTPMRLKNKTIAIFGFGRIGKAVASKAKAFGMQVVVVDSHVTIIEALRYGAVLVSKEEALEKADVITNHMSQQENNKNYFSYEEFSKVKPDVLFINVARGEAVDEEALCDALDRKLIRGAALDVLESETPDLKNTKLATYDNVILTPHAAFYSEESMLELQTITANNAYYYMSGEYDRVFGIVNEEVVKDLPPHDNNSVNLEASI